MTVAGRNGGWQVPFTQDTRGLMRQFSFGHNLGALFRAAGNPGDKQIRWVTDPHCHINGQVAITTATRIGRR